MWFFENMLVEAAPENAYGFVYLITNVVNNRKYIGRKYLTKAATKQRKGKRHKIRVQSDWKEYYGSSPELTSDIEKYGKDKFKREILLWCYSRAMCNYMELKYQFVNEVLESDDWYNSNIANKHWKRVIMKSLQPTI